VVFQSTSEPPTIDGGAPRITIPMAAEGADSFTETWSTDRPVRTGTSGDLVFAEDGEYLFCGFRVEPRATYQEAVRAAYEAAFELAWTQGYTTIFRMWNLVGNIVDKNADGMEIYQDFCVGRAEAFERWFARFSSPPAATGIGSLADGIDCYFLACREGRATFLENPLQMPAPSYPDQYGPRSPSFARATYLRPADKNAANTLYISGTASVVGHETIYGDFDRQFEVTIGNLQTLIGRGNLWRHGITDGYQIDDLDFVKVHVRDAEHLPLARKRCAEVFGADANVVYLNVDICRSDLLVEIEASCTQQKAGDR
jgi:chorismate lyase / 3-hydroxybenzoate synthase